MTQKRFIHIIISVGLLLCNPTAKAQDTLTHRTLERVVIRHSRPPSQLNAVTPTQVATQTELEQRGALQLSDAVKEMAGVSLKDYGGVGGVKTISMRGLGSQFSMLTIDGVAVNDAQNGQVDLGRYLLGGVSHVSMVSGQQSQKLQTARAYAAGNILNMESCRPTFLSTRHHLKIGMGAGSFGLLSPTLEYEQKIGKKSALSLSGNYMRCEGDYPFTLHYGTAQGDSTSRERRSNSQVKMATLDATLFHDFSPAKEWISKVHYVQGYHALPGPVTFYSTKGTEHSEEQLFFVQSRYRHYWNERLSSQVVAKYQRSNDVYEDTASRMSITGLLHNEYLQQEGYVSGSVCYMPNTRWHLCVAADEALNSLQSNLAQYNRVERFSSQEVVRLYYTHPEKRMEIDAHLLGTYMVDKTNGEVEERAYGKLSPYIGGAWTPAKGLRLRYFFKETFRAPNFNEMYYFTVPRQLEPEKAMQQNIGITYAPTLRDSAWTRNWVTMQYTLDGYYNKVSNKIIAVPTQNMFLWSMMNVGKVAILGADLTGNMELTTDDIAYRLSFTYSYQHAVDKTDENSKTYNNQIPYTPRHSANLNLYASLPWMEVGITAALVGKRYSMQENTVYSALKGYTDIGWTMAKEWTAKGCKFRLAGQILNLLDVQYEVVKSYPMMGRNYRINFSIQM